MDKPLRVLIVEDSADDALLAIRELERGGYDTTFERVETAEDMTAALEKQVWDIVIADYRLPHFSAPEALDLFKETGLDLPFIVISGTVGEETAVATMKAGAHDYLMKGNLTRLAPAIERELREAAVRKERKQADYDLRKRMKEIQCLHSIDLISARPKITVDEICQEVVSILPQAWQYPEITYAKITVNGKEFKTANCGDRGPKWKQSSDVELYGVKAGEVEIVYREEKPKFDEGPFLKEERQLINSVARQLARIIEAKQAEEALRESEEKLRSMFESIQDGVAVVALTGQVLDVNEAHLRMFGYIHKEELIGQNAFDSIAEKDRTRAMEGMAKISEEEPGAPAEYTLQNKDGREFYAEISSALLRDSSGNPAGVITVTRDITERKLAEENIEKAAEEWRTTFDSITDSVSIHDKDFRLVRVNKACADLLKKKPKELIGKHCYEIFHGTKEPVPYCPHKKTLETKKPATEEYFEPHLGIHLEVAISPIFNGKGELVASVHVARDITERKKMEEQLIVTDRLASVGELASGIAHELNNPLTGVIGFSQLLLEKDVADDVKEDIKIIYSEAQRTAEVVKNLLTFARKHAPVKQLVNINGVIEKVLELRAYEQRVSNIQVNTQFAPDLPEIMADYFQLQQVFLNIIINSEHFMIEAHRRGTLAITMERIGNIIKASFADDGPGIAKENLGHLFDPFFTTKEVGKGTGLGLSICHGIITEHGGRIYAESKLGKGATFVVELPITVDEEGAVK